MSGIALYSTVFPGVEPFLGQWCRSVIEQSRRDFEIWIGLDSLSPEAVQVGMEQSLDAHWVLAEKGSTPAEVRQNALEAFVERVDYVVFVDSDDILAPSRVAAAIESLSESDVAACALEFADEAGIGQGDNMTLADDVPDDAMLPRFNSYGLSNTAYRAATLRACLPIPCEAVMVDWYLATRAWLMGASMSFDRTPRMLYRQHGSSMARVRKPFSAQQLLRDARRVALHFGLMKNAIPGNSLTRRVEELRAVSDDVDTFLNWVMDDDDALLRYVDALNESDAGQYWWESVAYPPLSDMWTTS